MTAPMRNHSYKTNRAHPTKMDHTPMDHHTNTSGPFPAGNGPPEQSLAKYYQATSVPQNGPRFKARSIVFTIYDLSLTDKLREYAEAECKYVRFGHETCPTTGRPHLQGWLQWSSPRQVADFWSAFGHPHVERRRGKVVDNQRYTAKEGDWEEYGEPPKQGNRTDWRQAVDQVRARLPLVDVIDAQPHLLPTIRALERLATLTRQPPKDRDVRVLYIQGPAGCGKTRAIHQAYPEAYWKPEGEWWDGYEGQSVVVLDDYYSDIRYQQLLRVLDRYPLRLPVKGGFVPAEYTTVLITSNANLDEQYPNTLGARREALYRRIHCVITATTGINAEHITDALRQEANHPQVRYPQAHKPADDPEAGSPGHA